MPRSNSPASTTSPLGDDKDYEFIQSHEQLHQEKEEAPKLSISINVHEEQLPASPSATPVANPFPGMRARPTPGPEHEDMNKDILKTGSPSKEDPSPSQSGFQKVLSGCASIFFCCKSNKGKQVKDEVRGAELKQIEVQGAELKQIKMSSVI